MPTSYNFLTYKVRNCGIRGGSQNKLDFCHCPFRALPLGIYSILALLKSVWKRYSSLKYAHGQCRFSSAESGMFLYLIRKEFSGFLIANAQNFDDMRV